MELIWLKTMKWNNRMPEKSKTKTSMLDELWWSLGGSGGRWGLWITPITGHMQGISDQRGCWCWSWPSPTISTSCFSWLSARFCLYNTSCVWRHSSSYYTASLIKPWLWARGAYKQSSVYCNLLCCIIWDLIIWRLLWDASAAN